MDSVNINFNELIIRTDSAAMVEFVNMDCLFRFSLLILDLNFSFTNCRHE